MALDCLGDRWTMLIIRELLGAPAHFNELRAGLPGIATNLLTDRLRRMEADDIVRRSGSPTSPLYSLTDRGMAARPSIGGARPVGSEPHAHKSTRA